MSMNVGSSDDDGDVMVDINTTPLIDVMLVLLIMLIITIPIQTHAVKMNMPQASAEHPPTPPSIIEIQVERNINFEWSHSNLENGRHKGREAADKAYKRYTEKIQGKQDGQLLIIEPTPEEKEAREKARRDRFIAVEQLRPWLHADPGY